MNPDRVAILTAAGGGMGAAAAKKLAAFAKLFADPYAAQGLRMNHVLPGFIDSLPEKDDRRVRIPMQRYGRGEEVAELIAFLASDKSSYMAGQNIRIDGGITRSV